MKRTPGFILCCLLITSLEVVAQKGFEGYHSVYPIGDDPSINIATSYAEQETILFEANPNVSYSYYNNFIKELDGGDKKRMQAYYISFRPQLRMYTEKSMPVKTPSYRALFATQQFFKMKNHNLFGFSLESGHYSNGQTGCAFSEFYEDGSQQCAEVYRSFTPQTDLSAMLNRRSGNFSTNLTELIVNYRWNCFTNAGDGDDIPIEVHSLKAGTLIFHDRFLGVLNFGGYSPEDIRIMGRYRHLLGYEYIRMLQKGRWYSLAANTEYIQGAHEHVNPFRGEFSFSIFPAKRMKEFGVFVSYIYGHDNYNFRFVDAGHQLALGVKWSRFPPVAVKGL